MSLSPSYVLPAHFSRSAAMSSSPQPSPYDSIHADSATSTHGIAHATSSIPYWQGGAGRGATTNSSSSPLVSSETKQLFHTDPTHSHLLQSGSYFSPHHMISSGGDGGGREVSPPSQSSSSLPELPLSVWKQRVEDRETIIRGLTHRLVAMEAEVSELRGKLTESNGKLRQLQVEHSMRISQGTSTSMDWHVELRHIERLMQLEATHRSQILLTYAEWFGLMVAQQRQMSHTQRLEARLTHIPSELKQGLAHSSSGGMDGASPYRGTALLSAFGSPSRAASAASPSPRRLLDAGAAATSPSFSLMLQGSASQWMLDSSHTQLVTPTVGAALHHLRQLDQTEAALCDRLSAEIGLSAVRALDDERRALRQTASRHLQQVDLHMSEVTSRAQLEAQWLHQCTAAMHRFVTHTVLPLQTNEIAQLQRDRDRSLHFALTEAAQHTQSNQEIVRLREELHAVVECSERLEMMAEESGWRHSVTDSESTIAAHLFGPFYESGKQTARALQYQKDWISYLDGVGIQLRHEEEPMARRSLLEQETFEREQLLLLFTQLVRSTQSFESRTVQMQRRVASSTMLEQHALSAASLSAAHWDTITAAHSAREALHTGLAQSAASHLRIAQRSFAVFEEEYTERLRLEREWAQDVLRMTTQLVRPSAIRVVTKDRVASLTAYLTTSLFAQEMLPDLHQQHLQTMLHLYSEGLLQMKHTWCDGQREMASAVREAHSFRDKVQELVEEEARARGTCWFREERAWWVNILQPSTLWVREQTIIQSHEQWFTEIEQDTHAVVQNVLDREWLQTTKTIPNWMLDQHHVLAATLLDQHARWGLEVRHWITHDLTLGEARAARKVLLENEQREKRFEGQLLRAIAETKRAAEGDIEQARVDSSNMWRSLFIEEKDQLVRRWGSLLAGAGLDQLHDIRQQYLMQREEWLKTAVVQPLRQAQFHEQVLRLVAEHRAEGQQLSLQWVTELQRTVADFVSRVAQSESSSSYRAAALLRAKQNTNQPLSHSDRRTALSPGAAGADFERLTQLEVHQRMSIADHQSRDFQSILSWHLTGLAAGGGGSISRSPATAVAAFGEHDDAAQALTRRQRATPFTSSVPHSAASSAAAPGEFGRLRLGSTSPPAPAAAGVGRPRASTLFQSPTATAMMSLGARTASGLSNSQQQPQQQPSSRFRAVYEELTARSDSNSRPYDADSAEQSMLGDVGPFSPSAGEEAPLQRLRRSSLLVARSLERQRNLKN